MGDWVRVKKQVHGSKRTAFSAPLRVARQVAPATFELENGVRWNAAHLARLPETAVPTGPARQQGDDPVCHGSSPSVARAPRCPAERARRPGEGEVRHASPPLVRAPAGAAHLPPPGPGAAQAPPASPMTSAHGSLAQEPSQPGPTVPETADADAERAPVPRGPRELTPTRRGRRRRAPDRFSP